MCLLSLECHDSKWPQNSYYIKNYYYIYIIYYYYFIYYYVELTFLANCYQTFYMDKQP